MLTAGICRQYRLAFKLQHGRVSEGHQVSPHSHPQRSSQEEVEGGIVLLMPVAFAMQVLICGVALTVETAAGQASRAGPSAAQTCERQGQSHRDS